MASFVVYVNGKELCSVGLTSKSSGSIDLTWLADHKIKSEGTLFFHVGATEGDEHLRWSMPQLEVGDEGNIKIVKATVADDPPTSRAKIKP